MAWILFLARRTSGMALLGWCELTTWKEATWGPWHGFWYTCGARHGGQRPSGALLVEARAERHLNAKRVPPGGTARRHVTLEPTTLPE